MTTTLSNRWRATLSGKWGKRVRHDGGVERDAVEQAVRVCACITNGARIVLGREANTRCHQGERLVLIDLVKGVGPADRHGGEEAGGGCRRLVSLYL